MADGGGWHMATFSGDWAKVKEELIGCKAGSNTKIEQMNIQKEGLIKGPSRSGLRPWHRQMIDDPWAICVSSARKLGMR